jgi:hypothetical protein
MLNFHMFFPKVSFGYGMALSRSGGRNLRSDISADSPVSGSSSEQKYYITQLT